MCWSENFDFKRVKVNIKVLNDYRNCDRIVKLATEMLAALKDFQTRYIVFDMN